ncbi:MAG: Ig-like domain-containing protein, partial [Chloroflexota bacterium]
MKKVTQTIWGKLVALTLLLGVTTIGLTNGSAQSTEPDPVALISSVGGVTMSDEASGIQLDSSSQSPTNLTKQDYYDAYAEAQRLLEVGITFRSRELQRLDPEMCIANPNPDPDKIDENHCTFSVTGVKNNYLDFSKGSLFWRFCADYDEPSVGLGNVPQASDDRDDLLQINSYGYCPSWWSLSDAQKTVRLASWRTQDLNGVPPMKDENGRWIETDGDTEIDIRNQMVDAQRIFGMLAMAEPADLVFDGEDGTPLIDIIRVGPNGEIEFDRDGDGEPDRVRDIGIYGLLLSTREIASVHLILGNEFMVDALRFPFSTDGADTEKLVRDEQAQLERALRQYELATEIFFAAMNYNLRSVDQSNTFIGDYFSDREFQLFTAASERTVTALGEIAKRDRLLGSTGDQVAIQRLEEAMLDQYLQGLALAYQATRLREDDPNTPDIDEGQNNFLNNGGIEILNNIRQLMQQTQNIRVGLNPLGYDPAFVPLREFEALLELACNGERVCAGSGGLLGSAESAGTKLNDSQRLFDTKFDQLKEELTNLEFDYDVILTEICGESTDTDGDELKDFSPCGFFDNNNNGQIDDPSETAGLIGDNYWRLLEAERELSLAARQVENLIEEIRIEEERAGQVIDVILAGGERISAYELAVGKLNAMQTTRSVMSSDSASGYTELNNSTTYAVKITKKLSANPLACVFGGCDVNWESSLENATSYTVGGRAEWATSSASQTVWSPNELALAQYNSISALKEAEANAKIEGANSSAHIKTLLLQQSELLAQIEISQLQLNQVINEHNMLVDRYTLTLTQRASTVTALQQSYLSKPYFRLFRDGAALNAARTLEQAQHAAYLAAKALEYHTLSPVPYMHELYRVRNPENLRDFLDKLAIDYAPIAPEKYSKDTYSLSLAEDILGLTDANLNPDRLLSDAEVEALRTSLFQEILSGNRIINPETGFDQIVIPFSTTLDNPEFPSNVFNNRISRTSSTDPGCTAGGGCRGVWLNIVTDQDPADLQGDFPKLTLTHAGLATYRNGNLQIVSYDPGPSLMVGRTLPDGFGGRGREAAVVSAHINLPPGAEPNTNLAYDNFYNLSVATTQWSIQLDLNSPQVNTQLDFSQIKDIELRMDTTYVTSQNRSALISGAADQATGWQLELENERLAEVEPDLNRYVGTVTITDPVPLGTIDTGFSLEIGPDNQVTGSLCIDCGPLFQNEQAIPISGSYDPADQSVRFTTGDLEREMAGRIALRSITFEGTLSVNGEVIEGSYVETITGFIARPVVSEGLFLVSRPSGIGTLPTQRQLLVSSLSPSIERNGTVGIEVLMRGNTGAPLAGIPVSLATDSGSLSTLSGTTDGEGRLDLTFTAGDALGKATVTVQADGLTQTRTIFVVSNAPAVANPDEANVDPGQLVVIDILANDQAIGGQLDRSSVEIVEMPIKGTLSVNPTTGAVTYTAAATSEGTDTFTYIVKNTLGIPSAAATVTITIN